MPTETKLSLALVATLCMAAASTAWAVSMTVNNYRLTNITERINAHEISIREGTAERGGLLQQVGVLVEQTTRLREDVRELSQDVKELGNDVRDHTAGDR